MSELTITGHFLGGTDIKVACGEACAAANRLGVTIEFDFNGVKCIAQPGISSEVLAENWATELHSESRYKIATGRRR